MMTQSKAVEGGEALVESLWGLFYEGGYKVSFWLRSAAFILILWFGALIAFAITPLNPLVDVMMWLPAAALVFAFFHLMNPSVVGATLATMAAKHVPGLEKVAKPALSGATTAVRWIATVAGLQMAAAIALRVIPLHNDRTLVSLFLGAIVAIVLLSIGNSSGLARSARGLLTIAVLVMLAIFFLGGRQGIQEKATEAAASVTATTSAPARQTTPAPPPTSGTEHVVTPRGNGGAVAQADTGPSPKRMVSHAPSNIGLLLKNDPVIASPGSEVVYRATLINNGQGDSVRISITEELPEGLHFKDGSRKQTQVVDNLASGTEKTIVFTIIVEENAPTGEYESVITIDEEDHVQSMVTHSRRVLSIRNP